VEAGSGSGAVHTYAQEGTYNVCLTVNNIAGSDTYCDSVSVIAAGIATVSNSNLVKIFPNPTTGNINLTFSNAQPTHVTVTNALGIVVSEESINNAVKNYALQLHDAANGIYFVKVVQGNETDVKKISLSK
jgi:PKD repeat protein